MAEACEGDSDALYEETFAKLGYDRALRLDQAVPYALELHLQKHDVSFDASGPTRRQLTAVADHQERGSHSDHAGNSQRSPLPNRLVTESHRARKHQGQPRGLLVRAPR